MTREIALHCMKSYSELHSDLCELCPIYGETGSDHCFEDALQYVIEKLEQEPTTKNDLAVDAVSRAEVLKLMQDNWHTHNGDWAMQESMDDIRALPSVTSREPILDQITEIIEPLRHLPIGEMSDIEWDILRVIDKYKGESEG